MQKGQLTQCTQQIRVVGTITFSAKRSTPMQGTQWMQWTQHAVDTVCSGIVVYGGGDIVFGAKGQQVDAVDTVCSTQWNSCIWWWGHCVWYKKVKPVDAVLCGCSQTSGCSGHSMQYAVCSGIVVYGGGDIVFGAKRSNQWTQYSMDAVYSMQ